MMQVPVALAMHPSPLLIDQYEPSTIDGRCRQLFIVLFGPVLLTELYCAVAHVVSPLVDSRVLYTSHKSPLDNNNTAQGVLRLVGVRF